MVLIDLARLGLTELAWLSCQNWPTIGLVELAALSGRSCLPLRGRTGRAKLEPHSSEKSAAKLIQQESLEKRNGQIHPMKRIVALRREAERRSDLREANLSEKRSKSGTAASVAKMKTENQELGTGNILLCLSSILCTERSTVLELAVLSVPARDV